MDPEAIVTFIGITSADEVVARQYLQVADENVQEAVALYYENGGSALHGQDSETGSTPADSIRAPIAPIREVLVEDDHEFGLNTQSNVLGLDTPRLVSQSISQTTSILPGSGLGPFAHITRMRQRGIFNQTTVGNSEVEVNNEELLESTGGQSAISEKTNKLAHLFRPPFDLISNIDFESAKSQGESQGKWLLINMQDLSDFQCQVLNRDLWKDEKVKAVIKENFIFLQFANDSVAGANYTMLYPVTNYPHISIIDPRTGERVKQWTRKIQVDDFVQELYEFLERYSLDWRHKNPVAKKPCRKSTVDHMTEQEQLDVAIRASMGTFDDESEELEIYSQSSKPKTCIDITDDDEAEPGTSMIKAAVYNKPDSTATTRIQIRMPAPLDNIIHEFAVNATVEQIYQHVKANLDAENKKRPFSLVYHRKKLDDLFKTISDCKLQNSALQMEFDK